MKLPIAERIVVVVIEKLRDYCLNPIHPRGRHKARVFRSSCGMTAEHVDDLREALLDAALNLEGATSPKNHRTIQTGRRRP